MTWWALPLAGAVRSKTGRAARRGLPRRSCICRNCCGVMPIRAILPARARPQKEKTGRAYRPSGCAHCALVAAGILPAVEGGILAPGPALKLSTIVEGVAKAKV